MAPIIPGLNDEDMPRVLTRGARRRRDARRLRAAAAAGLGQGGVRGAAARGLPLRADRVLHRIRETRGGELYDPRFGVRGRGEGIYAEAIKSLFQSTAARLGLATHH